MTMLLQEMSLRKLNEDIRQHNRENPEDPILVTETYVVLGFLGYFEIDPEEIVFATPKGRVVRFPYDEETFVIV